MRNTMMAILALSAAACGGSNQSGQAPSANQATANATGNEIAALPEGQRNAVFIRAIRDAGLPCQHVESSAPAGTYRGMPVWRATCRGGGQWTVVIGEDEVAQILNANEARLVTDAEANASASGAR